MLVWIMASFGLDQIALISSSNAFSSNPQTVFVPVVMHCWFSKQKKPFFKLNAKWIPFLSCSCSGRASWYSTSETSKRLSCSCSPCISFLETHIASFTEHPIPRKNSLRNSFSAAASFVRISRMLFIFPSFLLVESNCAVASISSIESFPPRI